MMVKLVDPKAVIRDPVTKRQLPAKGGEVPDSSFWIRRLQASEIRPMTAEEIAAFLRSESEPHTDQPSGVEPIPPLTTR